MKNPMIRAFVMLLVCSLIYGAIFSCNKIAADQGIPPTGYAFWQSMGAGAVLWVIAALRGAPPAWSWPYLRVYLVVGGVGISLPMALLTYAAPNLPTGIVTMVLALSPPLTYLLGTLVGIDRFRVLGAAGILFGLAGVALLVLPSTVLPSREMAGWFLLSLAAPIMFASANISAALLRPQSASSVALASGILLGAALAIAPIVLLTGQAYVPGTGSGDAALAIAMGINAVFVVLFLEIIGLAGPTFFAQFNYLAVVSGIAWGALLFHEVLGLGVWIALGIMVVGVVLTALRDRIPLHRGASG